MSRVRASDTVGGVTYDQPSAFTHPEQSRMNGKDKGSKGKGKDKGSGKGKAVCWNWSQNRTCSYGDQCRVVHDTAAGGAQSSRPEAKAKAKKGGPTAESPSQQSQATTDKAVGGTKGKSKGKAGDQKPVMCKYAKNPALGSCPEGNNCKHWHKESAYQRAMETWQSKKTANPKAKGKAKAKKGGGKGPKHSAAGTETAAEANEEGGNGRRHLSRSVR